MSLIKQVLRDQRIVESWPPHVRRALREEFKALLRRPQENRRGELF